MKSPGRQAQELPDVLTIREAAELLRLGTNSVYEAARRGELPSIRIGRRLLVPKSGLMRLLEGSTSAHPPQPRDE